jgi:hypothetical protein
MELIIFFWRVLAGGSVDHPDLLDQVPTDSSRTRHAFPDDPVLYGVPQPRPVSRESGHGKDGG